MNKKNNKAKLKIGLALGSGAARGCSHIGIINALNENGIIPDIVCGTSIGALVGASYAAGNLQKLEKWSLSLTKIETAKFFEINPSLNGFVNTKRMHSFLNQNVVEDDLLIENIKRKYGAVATDLETGNEIWFTEGNVIDAVWAAISLPGLFPAVRNNNKWLVDGGLVNPVPVTLCRELGADIVIAVNLNGDIVGKHFVRGDKKSNNKNGVGNKITSFVKEYTDALFQNSKDEENPPGLFDAIAGSVNIAQDRITRHRLSENPPDIILTPKLSHIGLLEFYRAAEAINEGKLCVEKMMGEIKNIIKA